MDEFKECFQDLLEMGHAGALSIIKIGEDMQFTDCSKGKRGREAQ